MTAGASRDDRARRWLETCREVLSLTRQQGEALGAEDYTRLDDLLTERGQLLAGLGDLREQNIAGEQLRGDDRWGEVIRLLREIARLDEVNQDAIAACLNSLRGDLQSLGKWRQAARAYGGGRDIPDRGVET